MTCGHCEKAVKEALREIPEVLDVWVDLGEKTVIVEGSKLVDSTLKEAIDEAGIKVTQNGAEAQLPWKQVYKITATKNNVLIYSKNTILFLSI